MRQTLYLAGLLLLLSCSKDESFKKSGYKQHKYQNYAQYEYYQSPENPNEVLQHFIDNNVVGYMEINEGIWHLEGATNFYFRHHPYDYNGVKIETYTFDISYSELGILSSDIKDAHSVLVQSIKQELDLSNNIKFQTCNVYVSYKNESDIQLKIDVVYFKDAIAVNEPFSVNATADRHNYVREHCNTNPAPDAGYEYYGKLAYKKLFNYTGIPVYVYHYGLNVKSYKDIHRPMNAVFLIDGDKLFARNNDQIYPYNSTYSCQEIPELDLYRDVVVNDIFSIFNINEICLFINLEDDHSIGGLSFDIHYYENILIGEYGTAVQANPSI